MLIETAPFPDDPPRKLQLLEMEIVKSATTELEKELLEVCSEHVNYYNEKAIHLKDKLLTPQEYNIQCSDLWAAQSDLWIKLPAIVFKYFVKENVKEKAQTGS